MDIKDFLIDEEASMIEAMERLNVVAKKVLFVTQNDKFVAAITDGDIRRWILRKGNLEAKVKEIANYSPIYLTEKDKQVSKKYMKKYSVEVLPILNDQGDIVSVVLWNDEKIERKKTLKTPVVIMAGGLGTRLYPYTKILPKPLIPIGEIPIAEHIINRFYSYGCQEFFMIVNHKKNMIKAYFNEIEKDYHIKYIDEDQPLGTGGGLSLLKGKIEGTFILSNCDILIDEDFENIYKYHQEEKNIITMVCSLKKVRIPYGVVEINETGKIENMREKPELSFFTNTGVYIVESRILDDLIDGEHKDFPDIIKKYMDTNEKVGIYPIGENQWLDMGQMDGMEAMHQKMGLF